MKDSSAFKHIAYLKVGAKNVSQEMLLGIFLAVDRSCFSLFVLFSSVVAEAFATCRGDIPSASKKVVICRLRELASAAKGT